MNNPFGYAWLPTKRSSLNGLVDLPHGAVNMANNARYMIMAAGNNPATGGIDQYQYVYRISLLDNPYNISFANHNRYHGGQPGRMHVQEFFVEALKCESGTYLRFALGEALGVTWGDSYPTGYGFNDKKASHASFDKGPFFPVCIPDLDITSVLVALSSISSRMYRVGFLNTIIVGGTLLTVLGKLVRPQFGLSEGIF